jgi:hypothetical protein
MASPRLDAVDFGLTYGGLRADPTHRATFVIPNRDAIHEKPLVSAAALPRPVDIMKGPAGSQRRRPTRQGPLSVVGVYRVEPPASVRIVLHVSGIALEIIDEGD